MLQKMYPEFVGGRGAAGLLTARVIAGFAFVVHGWPKIQTPASWLGYETHVPGLFQSAAAISEFVGGIFLILGLATPIAALGITATMLSAITIYHWSEGHPYIAQLGQVSAELAASYLAIMVVLMLAGPGTWSLDWLIMRRASPLAADGMWPGVAWDSTAAQRRNVSLSGSKRRPPRSGGTKEDCAGWSAS